MALTTPVAEIVESSRNPLLGKHESWGRVLLGDIATIQNGFPFKSSQFVKDKGMPLIRIRDVGADSTDTNYIGDYDPAFVVEPGDLLIGMDGDFNCARWRGPKGLLNQRVCRVILKSDIYQPRLLDYALPGYLKAINDMTSSVTVKHLSSKSIAEIPLPLPPMEQQRHIVAEIEKQFSRLDEALANLKRVKANLKRYKAAVFKAAVEGRLTEQWRLQHPTLQSAEQRWGITKPPVLDDRLPAIPSGWVYRRLKDFADRVSVGHVGPTSQYYCDEAEGVPFIRSQNVRPGRLDLAGMAFIGKEFHNRLRKSQLKQGDLLIVRVGANRGDSCVVPLNVSELNCANVVFARPYPGISEYLNLYFQSGTCQSALLGLTTGSAQGVINTKSVAEVPVAIPSEDEQLVLVSEVERRISTVAQIGNDIDRASARVERIRQSILAASFSGRLFAPTEETVTNQVDTLLVGSR